MKIFNILIMVTAKHIYIQASNRALLLTLFDALQVIYGRLIRVQFIYLITSN